MDAYRFYLFGPPHLLYHDRPLTIARRKQWGILVYLLLTRHAHERDVLASLFWPQFSQSRGRSDLRRELARLRHTVPNLLGSAQMEVALREDTAAWVDVWDFTEHAVAIGAHKHPAGVYCAACHDHLRAARALYVDDLLAGFSLADCPEFEDWHFFQQESLRMQLLDVLSGLAAMEMCSGNLLQAVPPLRDRLLLDPLHEESHRQLIWLYIHTGQRAAALRQYSRCRESLARDLGADPAPETTALFQQIRTLTAAAPAFAEAGRLPPTASDLHSRMPSPPCFVGRVRHLAHLHTEFKTAMEGSGRVVFVAGDIGTGKTALLNEFARGAMAAHGELIVASGAGSAPYGTDAPLLPFHDLFAMLANDFACQSPAARPPPEQMQRLSTFFPRILHTLVTTGPHLIGTLVAADHLLIHAGEICLQETDDYERLRALLASRDQVEYSQEAQHQLFLEAGAVLQELALFRPLLLLLDDLHWADTWTLNLLFHLGKRMRGLPLFIVGTYRPDEIAGDERTGIHGEARATRHPLSALIHELQREFGIAPVDLDAETPSERLAWLDALLASHSYQLSGPLRDLLYTQARGHPLFSTELLQLWCERGWLVRGEDASWQERHTPDPMLVPIKVAAAIRRRIDCLSADAVRLLQAAGTEGETFTLPAVAAALGWSERRTLELIATELIHQHSLVAEADGSEESVPMSFRFAVPMLRTYLNSQLDNWERRLLLGRMGDASGTRSGALRGRKPATL